MPTGFNYLLADRAPNDHARMGAARHPARGGKPFPRPVISAYLLVPAGVQGPGFLMLQNFRVIMKYNPAEAYALAIGHLADRLRGGRPARAGWPRHERVLTRDETLELQQLLARTASTSASRTGGSAPRPAPRFATSRRKRPRPGRFRLGGGAGSAARP